MAARAASKSQGMTEKMNIAALILALVALIYGVLTLRDFVRGGFRLSPSARIWLRIAIIFAVVAVLLVLVI